MNDIADQQWIERALKSSRPQALGALLRYFRDLDIAEEAFQEACLRALTNWPRKGRPRDPVACSAAASSTTSPSGSAAVTAV